MQKVFFEVGDMEPQVIRCKALSTLHMQEVGYMDPQLSRCRVLNTLHMQEVFVRSWICGSPGI